MEVVRIIHPVGQGAFYTEQIITDDNKVHNVVYDCGSNTTRYQKLVIEEEITSFFQKAEKIDLLFISHFDQDHVNGIKYLLKKIKVINVVIPLISKEDLWFYSSVITNFEEFLNSLADNSENLFAINTNQSEANHNGRNSNDNIIYLENLRWERDETQNGGYFKNRKILKSNTELRLSKSIDWYYIVYNYDKKERQEKLKEVLRQKSQVDPTFKTLLGKITLVENHSTTEDEVEIKNIISDIDLNEIKKVYTEALGKDGSNKSSLIVYSGGGESHTYESYFNRCEYASCVKCVSYDSYEFSQFYNHLYFHCEGCLYFGDNDLNQHYLLDDLRKKMEWILNDDFNHLGLIQVPHHGSKNNFNNKIFKFLSISHDLNVTNFFVSYGSRNGYGHPSMRVRAEIFSHNAQLYLVTENKRSVLMQHIITNKQE